jgi:acyl-CoA synthetase (AMP-forming)/AMP-acid ligase II
MLGRIIGEAAVRFGDQVAYDGWDRQLSYAQLDRESSRVAGGLAAAGVAEGDVVAIRLPSGADYLVSYLAAAKIGAITAGINPKLAPPEQDALEQRVEPRLTLTEQPPEADPVDRVPDDATRPTAIVFTSGTTGLPRGAVFGESELDAIARIDRGDSYDSWGGAGAMLASTQFPHIGFMTKLPWYLQSGARIVALDRWRADDVLATVAKHRMQSIGGIAAQIALLLRSPLLDSLDLSCVQALIVGGAMSPPGLVREARDRFGAAYSIRYSSTECGGVGLATAFDADDDEALHSIGRPRPGIDAAVADDGELLLRSPAMMRHYWNDPEATATTIVDGWLHTGDLVNIDDRELFRITGRLKDMYIRGGYNVAPGEVEAAISDHPQVAEVAIVPRADEVMGEIGVAVVVPRNRNAPPALDSVREHAANRLASWKLPEAIVVTDSLPLTPMQKIDRAALRDLASEKVR